MQCSLLGCQSSLVRDPSGFASLTESARVSVCLNGLSGKQCKPSMALFCCIQAGADGLLYGADDGSLLISDVNLRCGRLLSDLSSVFGRGGIGTSECSLGATLTQFDENGFYADGQANVRWLNTNLFFRTTGSTD
jgi:hypothetical protein